MGEYEAGIQIRLRTSSEQEGETYWLFPGGKGIVISPQFSGRGVLITDLYARRLEGKKIHHQQAWEAESKAVLYLDRNKRELPIGSRFGAPADKAKRRKI